MRFLRAVSRYIIGIVFIISSFVKAIDPIGVSLKIKEYAFAYSSVHLGDSSLWLAIFLCLVEFLTGVAILKVFKIRFFSVVALLMTAFFTIVTFFSAAFDLVADCGCFGDVIRLSAWGTFYKNIVLIIFCVIVFWQRKNYKRIANNFWEWIYLIGYSAFIICLSIYSLRNLPPADFTDFKPGRDLLGNENLVKYKTEVIYQKNGKTQKFGLDNLPDSTWEYVATNSEIIQGSLLDAQKTSFILKDLSNIDITEEVLLSNKPLVFISIYDRNISVSQLSKIKNLADTLKYGGGDAEVFLLSSLTPEETIYMLKPITESIAVENRRNIFEDSNQNKSLPFDLVYADYKLAITFNRSNGGVTYVKNGTVIQKWSSSNFSNSKIVAALQSDAEDIIQKSEIKSHLFIEISLAIIVFMVLILRFLSKAIYKTVKKSINTIEVMGE